MKSEFWTVALSTGISVPCFVQGVLARPPGDTRLLLLHAWGESWRSFDRLISALPSFDIVAPRQPDVAQQLAVDSPGS